MTKRIISLLLAAVFLTGCRLAVPEESQAAAPPQPEDRIVGMLVTLDTAEPKAGENPDLLHLAANRGKRIYARLQEEVYESEDGTTHTTHRMVFPEELGISFMGYRITPQILPSLPEEEAYWTSTVDEGISMEKNSFNTVNDDSFVQLEAVIYVSEEAEDLVLYMNPVYQTEAGEVYALGVGPVGYHGVSMADCSVFYGKTVTEEGNPSQKEGYVKMTLRRVRVPDHYRIIQMDGEDRVIKTQEISPGNLPERYRPEENCAYILLEEYAEGQAVKRSVKSRDDSDSVLEVLHPMESGICHLGHTQIQWEEAE